MRPNRFHKIPLIPVAGPLQDAVAATLDKAGYKRVGEPEIVNYHEIYCPIESREGGVVGTAWIFHLHERQLMLAGGEEIELDAAATKQLSNASEALLDKLTYDAPALNEDWRSLSRKNAAARKITFGAGVFIGQTCSQRLTKDGTALKDMLIVSGQSGLVLMPDGRSARLPKLFRPLAHVEDARRPKINHRTISKFEDRRLAAKLMARDICISFATSPVEIHTINSKASKEPGVEAGLVIVGGKPFGSVTESESIATMLKDLTAHNQRLGHDGPTKKPSEGSVPISTDAIQNALKHLEREKVAQQDNRNSPAP